MNRDDAWDRLIPVIMILNDLDTRALELHPSGEFRDFSPEDFARFAMHRELMSWYSRLEHALTEARDLIASESPEGDVAHWRRMVEVQYATRRRKGVTE